MTIALPPPPSLRELQRQGDVALFIDFDGTLIDLSCAPDTISVPKDLAADLEQLAAKLHGRLAVVTGRSIDDLLGHLGPLPVHLAGSHGAEVYDHAGRSLGGPESVYAPPDHSVIEAFVAERPDLLVETKPRGIAIHYRAAPHREDEVLGFAQELVGGRALALKRGKFVVEFVAPGADKGKAVDLLMSAPPFADSRPVFIGDDVTDDDGFDAVARHGGIAIAVGDRPTQAAGYRLADPRAAREWLFGEC